MLTKYLNKTIKIKIDRPLNSLHPKHKFKYLANYGYVPNTKAPDGEEIDAYVLGINKPLQEFTGKCIAIIRRLDDNDDKLVIVPQGIDLTDKQIKKQTHFQEKYFKSEITRKINENKRNFAKNMKIILEVKPFQETLNASMCGPATLKILLDYYGIKKSEKELARMSGWNKTLGIDDQAMKKTAEKLGFKVKIKNNSKYSDLQKWLEKGIPVIVNWFTRGRNDYPESETADGHYSVVMGLDDKFIYLQDPEIGRIRKIKKYDFMRVWFDFQGDYINPKELIIRQMIVIYK